MKNMFDIWGDFFQSHRLFGPSSQKRYPVLTSVQKKTIKTIAEITSEDLKRYAKHKDKQKSIFNPRNTERLVHYKAERFYLIDRDMRRCLYCGTGASEKALQPDHILPYSKIPVTHMDNLGMACVDCNSGKGDRIISRATLTDILELVQTRNDAHFPRRKFKEYRRDYCKLLRRR